MSRAISVICTVAMAEAAQVPLPAKAKTRGMVRTGERTGAIHPLIRPVFPRASGCHGAGHIQPRGRMQGQLWSQAAEARLQKTGFKMTGFASDVDGDGGA